MNISFKIIPVFCFLCVVSFSCLNPFAPRLDTEPSSQLCTDLTTIENIFCTFRQAYAFKDTTLYSSILSENFVFTFRDYDRGVDVSWGRTDDMHTTYGLFQNVQSLELIWNNIISSSGDDTMKSIIRGFNLTVTFNPSEINRVDGYANLTLARTQVTDDWQIVRWRDESNY
ncbi:MAG: hypothetical protein HYZ33_02700 [Ignavibacteriales bacterium]|nr:hypothetical protein [Ignavibacteriales bacterium]